MTSRHCHEKLTRSFPHPQYPCHTPGTPAAGWIANASVQVGGMPFKPHRNVRWRLGEAVTSVAPLADLIAPKGELVQPATGPSSGSVPAVWRVGAGQRTGPVADCSPFTGVDVRAGNHATKPCAAALVQGRRHGETHGIPRRTKGPQAGEAKWLLPVGCGHHPAKFGPARVVRHPYHYPFRGDARARPSGA